MIFKLKKIYYHLTAYIPRRLPSSEAEFMKLKDILINYYDVLDEPQTYHMLAGQITSVPATKIRKPYGELANAIKRLKINSLAQCYRIYAQKEMEAKMASLAEEQQKDLNVNIPQVQGTTT